MNCETVQSVLLDPQDPAVDRQLLLQAASHALTCETCRRFAEDLSRMESVLRVPDDETIALPHGGYAGLEQRLARGGQSHRMQRGKTRWLTMAGVIGMAAVVGGVIAGAYFFGVQQGAVHTESVAVAPRTDARLAFSPSEVRRSSRAFAEVSQAFDNRASWVLTGDHAADMGVVQSPVDSSHPLLLFKLVLRSGGQILSSGDLAIISGRDAHVTLPLDDGKRVRYSISTKNETPDRLGISAELLDSAGSATPLAALSTRIQPRPGQPVRAGEMSTTSGDYEVLVSFAQASVPSGDP